MDGWGIQIASDLKRDGLGAELMNRRHEVVAEVFRCDADNTLVVNVFMNDIPLVVFEWFVTTARERLGAFEDGSPLPTF